MFQKRWKESEGEEEEAGGRVRSSQHQTEVMLQIYLNPVLNEGKYGSLKGVETVTH